MVTVSILQFSGLLDCWLTQKGLMHTSRSRLRLDAHIICYTHMTYRQPAQNGVLTDQLCRAIYCIHLSIMPMQIAITITWSDNWSVIL